MEFPYYLLMRADGRFELRQTRFIAHFNTGREHPHDVMASFFRPEEMSALIDKHFSGMVDKHPLSLPVR